jgi:hypothetical protein
MPEQPFAADANGLRPQEVSGVAVVARCYGLSAVRFDPCARSFSIVCS